MYLISSTPISNIGQRLQVVYFLLLLLATNGSVSTRIEAVARDGQYVQIFTCQIDITFNYIVAMRYHIERVEISRLIYMFS